MTRDEAIKIAAGRTGEACPINFIDLCAELGMLKLDEPKSVEEARAIKVFEYAALDGCKPDELVKRLSIAGLRIVEK